MVRADDSLLSSRPANIQAIRQERPFRMGCNVDHTCKYPGDENYPDFRPRDRRREHSLLLHIFRIRYPK